MKHSDIISLMEALKDIMAENKTYLIELDSVVGDGDLGLTMSDGFKAAYDAVAGEPEIDIGKLLFKAGKAMSSAVPSTMGTLMASGLMSAGKALKGKTVLEFSDLILLFESYEAGVTKLGKSAVGEKTFLDGLHPAVVDLKMSESSNADIVTAAKSAAKAAMKGYQDTAGMLAVHGRAATRGEASRRLKDPGAYVAALMMQAFEKSIQTAKE